MVTITPALITHHFQTEQQVANPKRATVAGGVLEKCVCVCDHAGRND